MQVQTALAPTTDASKALLLPKGHGVIYRKRDMLRGHTFKGVGAACTKDTICVVVFCDDGLLYMGFFEDPEKAPKLEQDILEAQLLHFSNTMAKEFSKIADVVVVGPNPTQPLGAALEQTLRTTLKLTVPVRRVWYSSPKSGTDYAFIYTSRNDAISFVERKHVPELSEKARFDQFPSMFELFRLQMGAASRAYQYQANRAAAAKPAAAKPSAGGAAASAEDWIYHTTNVGIARAIKKSGFRSRLDRTGTLDAEPTGGFARDRDKTLALPVTDKGNKKVQYLQTAIAYLKSLGLDEAKIEALTLAAVPIGFVPTGADEDAAKCEETCYRALKKLAAAAGLKKQRKVFKIDSPLLALRKEVVGLARKLAQRPQHCLTIWADEYAHLHYRVEEVKTARHVYFLKSQYAEAGYASYTKGVAKDAIAVLRVKRSDISGLKDDISEFMAECTETAIIPAHVQIMTGKPEMFIAEAYRNDAGHWKAIERWAA
jgi:hypothetical protein